MSQAHATFAVVSLSGSPSATSHSSALLRHVERRLGARVAELRHIAVRDLPAVDLLHARAEAPALRSAIAAVQDADLVLVATPIYKAAYSGLLKAFLDLLPPDALRGKTVLPLATGGSPGHQLALDYALKPVLAALGARHVLDAVFVLDAGWRTAEDGSALPAADVVERIDAALQGLAPARRGAPAEAC